MTNKSLAAEDNSDIQALRRSDRSHNTSSIFPIIIQKEQVSNPPSTYAWTMNKLKYQKNLWISSIVITTSFYEEPLTKLGTNISGFVIKKGTKIKLMLLISTL
ncbi:hypothetical protein YYC_04121 [Plasmodium yoelii 17X]|uniref:Uncharacterized protein n=1 Tax=Plasmodium yoelii 17X TaxID=1323249 RepID=V7PI89_PLAYE|nr:hypothetical protein YYC_04121 [Plasmodium yoelii 17X]